MTTEDITITASHMSEAAPPCYMYNLYNDLNVLLSLYNKNVFLHAVSMTSVDECYQIQVYLYSNHRLLTDPPDQGMITASVTICRVFLVCPLRRSPLLLLQATCSLPLRCNRSLDFTCLQRWHFKRFSTFCMYVFWLLNYIVVYSFDGVLYRGDQGLYLWESSRILFDWFECLVQVRCLQSS